MAPLPPRPPPVATDAPPPPPGRVQRWRASAARWWALAAAVALVVASPLVALLLGRDAPPPLTRGDVATAAATIVEKALEEQARRPADAAVAYRAIAPSLVVVRTAGRPEQEGLGAGVVVNAQGLVLTANHVVDDGGAVTVIFADGTESPARVQRAQPENDIAVLAPERLPPVVAPAVLGGGVQTGDPVFAVGHPLGLNHSLSAGVVSATGRTISGEGRTLADLIQFDAAVNPGNSGGPLLNPAGQVVGVVTALANPSKQPFFVGIGFAVPIATAGGAAGGPAM